MVCNVLKKKIDYNQLETPCFLFDELEYKRSVGGFRNALLAYFDNAIIGHSVKTNSLPGCLMVGREFGVYAEVVSEDEYLLALECGFDRAKIIYNGPLKSKDTFLDALKHNAYVNIETKRELMWLEDLPKNQIFQVGIRLNVNISKVSIEDAEGEDDNSRFGFSDQTTEFKEAVDYITSLPNVKLTGLHIHRTSHSRSVRFYEKSIAYAAEVIRKYNLELSYLDIGGGYFGIFPNKPTYREYVSAFYTVLKNFGLEHLLIIVEPGNAIVASAFEFVSKVIDVKHVEEGIYFVTTDGSRNDVDPFFKKKDYLKTIYRQNELPCVAKQIIGGCTCLEYDRLFSLENESLMQVGDKIVYHNVGAYTMCLSPLFIRYFPKVYKINGENCILIRDRWKVIDYMQEIVKN